MAREWKLVVDCADPIRLARFWAEALDYQVEDNSALIDRLVAAGAVPPQAYVEVAGRKAWRELAAVRHPDDPVDPASGTGLGRRLLFQAVPEPKQVKNRLHLDLHVGPDGRDAEVERLVALGATVLREVADRGSVHTTMADPEGNEFDVQ
ncbi:VOC family protein [Micromonospora auratinigra]|uniref:Glyoxalase-like domain n=1 Tax=Micromonospora auratinigra TaxID=261654 RepID=A0A1A8ZWY0_9ACTN|nr:VOC family protein [Micromonospora auratinigra]SBT48390.1 Glyoxalase-like domain [Micromonospora auratinigra]